MKKTILIVIGLPALASSLLFGVRGAWDRVQAGISQIREAADDNSDPGFMLHLARKQYSTAQEKLTAASAMLTQYEKQADQVVEQIVKLEQLAASARCRLETLRPVIAGADGGWLTVGHCRYSPCEVQAAARSLAGAAQESAAAIEAKRAHLKLLKQATAAGRSALEDARAETQKVESRIRTLAVQLETEAARKETTDTIAAIKGSVNGEMGGELTGTLETLEKQLANMKHKNDAALGSAAAVNGIAWENSVEPIPVLELVDNVLKKGVTQTQAANAK